MSILDIVLSVVSGGATGLLGAGMQMFASWAKGKQDIELQKLKNENNLAALKLQAETIDKEWAHRVEVAKVEEQGRSTQTANEAFAASFSLEPKSYSEKIKPTKGQAWVLVLLDGLRGIVRPGLTVYLCVLTTLIYFQSRDLLKQENLDAVQALDITQQVIHTILYLCTTVVLWWFGTRNTQQAPATKV